MSDNLTKRYVLNRFKTTGIKKDRIIFLCGKRGSGKTTGVMDILYRHRDIQMAMVMCGTEESAEQYRDYFPDSFIYGKYDEEVLRTAVKAQKRRLFEHKMGRRRKVPYICILLDDCMFEKPLSGKFMRNLFMNGRHWKIMLIITCQYVIDVPAALRGQIDYAMLFKNNSPQEREKMLTVFGTPFPKDKGVTFNQIMDQCTRDFGCMVIDNTANGSRLEESVFYFRPKRRENFRIGSAGMWRYHHRRYYLEKAMMGPPEEDDDDGGSSKKRGRAAAKARGRGAAKDDIVVVLRGIQRPTQTISNS
jgi:hypothetical protein